MFFWKNFLFVVSLFEIQSNIQSATQISSVSEMTAMINYAAPRIIDFITTRCQTPSHLAQILGQLVVGNLSADTRVAAAFISTCTSLSVLTSAAFPLFINNHTRPHTFVCNTLISAFSHSNPPQNRRSPLIFSHMLRNSIPVNEYTFPLVLKAFADLKLVKEGQSMHSQIVKFGFASDLYVVNSLLNLYAADAVSGDNMILCRQLFGEMPVRDVVTWTTLISGFKECRKYREALAAFHTMTKEGVMPNQVSVVNALVACAGMVDLEMGEWLHDSVKREKWKIDVTLGTALIEMYGRCGRIKEGLRLFEEMTTKNVSTWNAVIRGLAFSRDGDRALNWFWKMQRELVQPDDVTLAAVLNTCMVMGYVDTGRHVFSSLVEGEYGLRPTLEHFNIMIDLLGRNGFLDEMWRLTNEMPFEPCVSTWSHIFSACRAHRWFRLAEYAAWKLVEMQPQNGAYYVQLSNLYAENGFSEDLEKVQSLMEERGIEQDVGCSALEALQLLSEII